MTPSDPSSLSSPGSPGSSGASGGSGSRAEQIPPWARPFLLVIVAVGVMWAVEIIDLLPRTNLDRWGVRPRQLGGLTGIVTAPFLHNGLPHLISNTIPFLVLGGIIAASGVVQYLKVSAVVALSSGLGAWLFGQTNSVHIGASGMIFGYLTYLLTRGLFERKLVYLAVGLVVLFLYGSVLWGLVPRPGISWQMHLFGAIGGIIAARLFHADRTKGTATATPAA